MAFKAGEILLNCIDRVGTNSGFDHELIKMVKDAVTIPVIASSGAGYRAALKTTVGEMGRHRASIIEHYLR